jgi:hypothetical protein
MKPISLRLLIALMGFGYYVSAQRFLTNKIDAADAAKAASHLQNGMSEQDIDKVLETNGLTVGYTIGGTAGGTRFYLLSDGCSLDLDVSLNPRGWTNKIFRAASIQSNGVKIASITLTNRP